MPSDAEPAPAGPTRGKVALFATCYGNYNEPHLGEDLVAVFEHNGIPVTIAESERCCGMPKLELGNLEAVERAKDANVATLLELIDEGWDIVAPVPSCVLMFKQELPLMFPDDADVAKAARFAVRNSFRNAGQVCVSTERIYVHEAIADAFEAALADGARALQVGDGADGVDVGPVVSAEQAAHVRAQVDDALQAGARLVAGGEGHHDNFVVPTVLADVDHSMDVMQRETGSTETNSIDFTVYN